MNLDIEHLAITLQSVSPDLGSRISELLGGALTRQLSDLKLRSAIDMDHADLGVIDAPAGADAQTLTELIASRLVDWIERQENP